MRALASMVGRLPPTTSNSIKESPEILGVLLWLEIWQIFLPRTVDIVVAQSSLHGQDGLRHIYHEQPASHKIERSLNELSRASPKDQSCISFSTTLDHLQSHHGAPNDVHRVHSGQICKEHSRHSPRGYLQPQSDLDIAHLCVGRNSAQ